MDDGRVETTPRSATFASSSFSFKHLRHSRAVFQKHDLPSRRHSSLSSAISPQKLSISSESCIAIHVEILNTNPLALQRKPSSPLDTHPVDIPSSTSSKLRLCQSTFCSRTLLRAYPFTVSIGCLAFFPRSATAVLVHVLTKEHCLNLPIFLPGRSHQQRFWGGSGVSDGDNQ